VGPAPAGEVYAIPEGDDPVKYAGAVLTQVGYNSGVRPPAGPDARAVVVGDGMVGLWAAQTLQMRGARVALLGRHDMRLGLFGKRDGDLALNTNASGWFEQALDWAGGEFQTIVDTVGYRRNADLNTEFVRNMRWGGHFVIAGDAGPKAHVCLTDYILKEVTIHCPCGWLRDRMEKTIELIGSGDLKTAPLITHHFPAQDAATAWEKIFTERDATLGVVLDWD